MGEYLRSDGSLRVTPTRARTAGLTPGNARSILGRTPLPGGDVKQNIVFTPSTPEDHQIFDDEDVPVTREEFRKLRKQLKETRKFAQ